MCCQSLLPAVHNSSTRTISGFGPFYTRLSASRNLAYLQLLDKEPAMKVSFKRCLGVLLRYPGLCRYNVWWVSLAVNSLLDECVVRKLRLRGVPFAAEINVLGSSATRNPMIVHQSRTITSSRTQRRRFHFLSSKSRDVGTTSRQNSLSKSTQCRAHSAHCKLHTLAMTRNRRWYEALRASYNSIRPAGHPPAPPLEEWRGVSDIYDHTFCRYGKAFFERDVDYYS